MLDSEMKDLLLLFSSTTGRDKTVHGDAVGVKQNEIRALVEGVQSEAATFLE